MFLYELKHIRSFSNFFFSIWVFFHEHSWITRLQGKGEGISLTPHYHFHPLHRHLDISWAITAESSPLYIVSNRTQTGNLWFPSANREVYVSVPLMILMKPNLQLLCQFSVGCSNLGEKSLVFTKNYNDVINALGKLAYISIWHLPVQIQSCKTLVKFRFSVVIMLTFSKKMNVCFYHVTYTFIVNLHSAIAVS